MTSSIPKRVSTAVLQSLGAGVVPRAGLEYIAVGRKDEINTLLNDLDNVVSEGGATFRLVLGRYGSGKSFLAQLIRNYALQRNFVVADADLNPTVRLTGSKGQGLNLYKSLLNNLATRTRPNGNAFQALLERWIGEIQSDIVQTMGLSPDAPGFNQTVEQRIHATMREMEGFVHGFDFATVLTAYWLGHQKGDDIKKGAALRWLRGEFSTKTEAREQLGVRIIIDDDSWYEYIKLLARFVKDIGYQGLVVFVDEAVNLYKISNTVSRNNNYERLLNIFNDTLQGKVEHLGFIFCGTPQMVEDKRRGLFSYEALRTRLEESRYSQDGYRDLSGPMIRLQVLSSEEIFSLLQRLREVHGIHWQYDPRVTDSDIQHFMTETLNRLGVESFLTPREVVRDFITVLNIMHQNPGVSFGQVIGSDSFQPTRQQADPEMLTPETEIQDEDGTGSVYTNFQL